MAPSAAPTAALPRATALGRTVWALLALGAWAVLLTALRLHADPRGFGTHQQLGLPPCGFAEATGIPCPGCGLTTSFTHMAHGHLLAAFGAHLMGPPLFLMTLAVALYAPYAIARARPLSTLLDSRATVPALVITAAAGVLTFVLRVVHW
jgi:hypothetical protein